MNRDLSSIELTVLGLAWLRGPCTTYAIMKELSLSESSFHRSRAGTAYSVSKRLLAAGFLARDTSKSEQVVITESGVQALTAWVAPPVPLGDIAHSADMIRLRFFFLGALEPAQRLVFIDTALEGLQEFLARCESLLQANQDIGDYFGFLATVSSVYETRARISWLRFVRTWVEKPLGPEEDWTTLLRAQLPPL